jgi:hypothetical protein
MERPTTLSKLRRIESQRGLMSPDVRHELPTEAPHRHGSSMPHSHMENKIGLPVTFSASLPMHACLPLRIFRLLSHCC